jgi:L-amino acid N-acyltransferase YncA
VWCAQRDISREHTLDIPLALPGDACYVFKAFTVPAYRGRRIHNITLKRVLVELGRQGKTRGIAIIEYGNVASMRSHERVGMKPQGWIATLGRGRFAWRWYAQATRQCGFGGRSA